MPPKVFVLGATKVSIEIACMAAFVYPLKFYTGAKQMLAIWYLPGRKALFGLGHSRSLFTYKNAVLESHMIRSKHAFSALPRLHEDLHLYAERPCKTAWAQLENFRCRAGFVR